MKKLLIVPLLLISFTASAKDFRCWSLGSVSDEEAGEMIVALHKELGIENDNDFEAQRAFIEPICRKYIFSYMGNLLKEYYIDKEAKRILALEEKIMAGKGGDQDD